jgi:hypothetical protein
LKYERAAARSGPSTIARDLWRGSIEMPPAVVDGDGRRAF